jgi:hypothetical protein
MEYGDICRGRLGDDVLDQAVQQFCSILDRQLRVGSKLHGVLAMPYPLPCSNLTLQSASNTWLK